MFNIRPLRKTRSHTTKLDKKQYNLKGVCNGFFTVRVVKMWNSLLQLEVSAESVDNFIKLLDLSQ